MAAWMVGVAGGFAVPCAPLRRLVGAMVRPGGRSGPQEPPAARRRGRTCGSSRRGMSMMPASAGRGASGELAEAGWHRRVEERIPTACMRRQRPITGAVYTICVVRLCNIFSYSGH